MPYPQGSSSIVQANSADEIVGTQIVPAVVTETKNVKSFTTSVVSLDLFNSVTVAVTLYNEDNGFAGVRTFVIGGDEYLAWNNDDQYLITLVAQKLGFTLA